MKFILSILLLVAVATAIETTCDPHRCNFYCNKKHNYECGIKVKNGYIGTDCPIGNCLQNNYCQCYLNGSPVNY